jgi:AcrR family transcriptional regulator
MSREPRPRPQRHARRDERPPRQPRRHEDAGPIWSRPAPGERRPSYTREQIAAVALEIADAEGFEAVTMRRIARELRAGTMTLYHYVRNKSELAALMDDTIMGELIVPEDELADDWREAMAQIARRTYQSFMRHPWTFELIGSDDDPGIGGPNAIRHVEQSLSVAARTGLDFEEQFELTALVDEYVFGHALRSGRMAINREDVDRRLDAMIRYMEAQLATGEFPHLKSLAGDDVRAGFGRMAAVATDEERFERGLQTLLDGIELRLRATAPPRRGRTPSRRRSAS